VTDAAALSGVDAGANAKVEAMSSLTVNETVEGLFGDVLLASSGSDVVLNADVTAGQDLTINARDAITQNADLTTGGSIYVRAMSGAVTMDADASSSTSDSNIRYDGQSDVTVGVLDAGTADISVTAGGSVLDAHADTVGVDGDGFATNAGRTVNLVASDLRLEAGADIGSAGDPLDTSVDTVATTAGTGSTYVYETDTLSVGTVDPVTVSRVALESTSTDVTDAASLSGVTAGMNAKVETIDGTLTIGDPVEATSGDALLAGNGTGSDLDINATVTSGGNVTLLARNNILQGANVTASGSIDAQAYVGSILMASDAVSDADDDNIRYTAEGDVEVGVLDAGTGSIAVNASTGSIHDAQADTIGVDGDGFATNTGRTVNLIGSDLRLDSAGDIGEAGNPLDTSVDTVAAAAGTGTAYVYENDAVTIGTVAPVSVSRVALESTSADVTDAADLSGVTAGANAKVETIAGTLTVDDAVEASGGDVLLAANGGDLDVNATVTSSGNMTLLASNAIMQGANVMAGGTVGAEALSGSITMDANTMTEADNDDIRYAAGDSIALAMLDAGDGSVSLVAGGDISDAGAAVNVQAGTVQLTASGSIGADGAPVTVDAGQTAARADGSIHLTSGTDLVVGTADAVTVNRVALESTSSTVEDASIIGIEAGGDVSLGAGDSIRLAVAVGSLDPASDPVPGVDGNAATIVSGGSTTLGTAVVLDENSRIAGGSSVTFTSTVDSAAGSNNDLAVHSPDTTYADTVGSTQALGNLTTTDAGDGIIRVGGNVTTVDGQLYGEATQITADSVALSDSGAGTGIQLDSTLDGDGSADADLTVNISDGGDLVLTGDVGATNRLGDVTIGNVNDLTAEGTVSAASFTQNASTGDTVLNGALDTDVGDVSINTNGGSITVAAIDSAGDITLLPDSGTSRSPNNTYDVPDGTITLTGDLTGGSIQLGPDDRGVNALGVSSIVGLDPDGDLVIDASGTLTIGADEKFAVLDADQDGVSQLTLRTAGGAIQHGDLTVEGDLLVDGGGTAPLTIVTRSAGDQQDYIDNNGDGVVNDLDIIRGDGVDIVATGSITYTGVEFITESGETPDGVIGQPQFALTDPDLISENILETYGVRQLDYFPEIRGDVVNPAALGGLVLDAVANGEFVNSILSSGVGRPTLAESLPAPERETPLLSIILGQPDMDKTTQDAFGQATGLQVRDRNSAELNALDVVTYDDAANAGVSVGRIDAELAGQVVEMTQTLLDPAGNNDQLRGELAQAVADYMARSDSYDAGGFRDFVIESRTHAEANRIMDSLYELWMTIEILGLNEEELEKLREYIYSEIVPANLTIKQLHDAVMSGGEPMIAYAGD
jgi:hypothetical protein